MPYHHPTQFPRSKHFHFFNATHSLIYLFFALFFLSVGLSHATPISQEKKPKTAKGPANTQPTLDWVKGRVLIMPRAGLSAKQFEKTLKPHGVKSRRHIKELDFHIVELPTGADEVKIMRALKKDRRLKNVELDMIVTHDLSITDPSYSNSWALPKIQAPTAWDTSNGDGIIIAILDTGVDSTHPDLAANIVPGWNMWDNNADTTDIHGHGTWVAGAAAAAANNGSGSAGVSWASSIMPIRISRLDGFAYFSTIAQGIRWAADNGAKVVNNSFGGVAGSSIIQSAAEYLRSKGGVVVVSAGNTGTLLNYAPSDSLLVAAATASNDVRPSWSSYGPYVDISAPGVSIYTTSRGGGYSNVSGTSFSSPIVAATAALMLSANSDLTPADVGQILMSTAVDLGTIGFDDFYGAGRVDAAKAVEAARMMISVDNQAPTITIKSPTGGEVAGTILVDVNYSDNVGVVRTELFANGQKVITDNLPPFAFAWDSTSHPDGDYTLTAYAFDAAGNQASSPNVLVSISNDTTTTDTEAPVISFKSPTGGEVSGTTPVSVNYSDNIDVVRVELYVNGQQTMTNSQAPFTLSWDTTLLADGAHTLTAHAFDEAGNEGTSSTISVAIKNTVIEDTTAPVITNFNLTDGMKVSRKQTVSVSATDNQGIAQITLTIDGNIMATSGSNSLSYNWNTRAKGGQRNATYSVTVQVTDDAGNTTSKTATVQT